MVDAVFIIANTDPGGITHDPSISSNHGAPNIEVAVAGWAVLTEDTVAGTFVFVRLPDSPVKAVATAKALATEAGAAF